MCIVLSSVRLVGSRGWMMCLESGQSINRSRGLRSAEHGSSLGRLWGIVAVEPQVERGDLDGGALVRAEPLLAFLGGDEGAHLRQAPLHAGELETEVGGDLGLEPAGGDRARDAHHVVLDLLARRHAASLPTAPGA